MLESLGYVAGGPSEKKSWEAQDDLKALMPVIIHAREALDEYRKGNIKQAIAKLNVVIRIRPNYISAISDLASIYFNWGKFHKALQTLNSGLDKNPDNLHLTILAWPIWVLAAWKRPEKNSNKLSKLTLIWVQL